MDQVKVAVAQAKSDLVNSPDAVNQSGGGTDADQGIHVRGAVPQGGKASGKIMTVH